MGAHQGLEKTWDYGSMLPKIFETRFLIILLTTFIYMWMIPRNFGFLKLWFPKILKISGGWHPLPQIKGCSIVHEKSAAHLLISRLIPSNNSTNTSKIFLKSNFVIFLSYKFLKIWPKFTKTEPSAPMGAILYQKRFVRVFYNKNWHFGRLPLF